MHTYKSLRIELRLECADCMSEQVRLLARVKSDVVSFRFEPVNLLGLYEEYVAIHFDDQTFEMNWPGLDCFERVQNPLIQGIILLNRELGLRAFQRFVEAFLVKRLQQIVQCKYLKCSHCVLIISCHKDNGG